MNNPKPGTSLFSTETSKKFDRAALRWITIPASAAATGFLVYYIADDAFPENTATAFGWLGALASTTAVNKRVEDQIAELNLKIDRLEHLIVSPPS